jgi:RHS repeat-associated protein
MRLPSHPQIALITAALTALPSAAFALGGPAPGAVSAQTVKLPSGPGSVRGLADDAAVSGFTGQVQYAIPIELPSCPGGLTPSLQLGYDGGLGNGPIGVGWSFAQPGIRRTLRLGVPSYTAQDELEVTGLAGGGKQLVAFAGPSGVEYRVEGEGNGYVGRAVGEGFEVTAPDGKVYRFGTAAVARKASGTRVATWYLEEVRDVTGQVITYQYRQDRGEVYMDSISWGPILLGVPAFRAELVFENRSDAVVSYRTGFRVESAQRLAQIKIWSFGAVRRVVALTYDSTFALSRLASVKVTSGDGLDALPPLSFRYAAATSGAIAPISGLTGWALNLQGTSLADVDGDGAMDLLRLLPTGHSYRRNLGGRFDVARPLPGATGASLDQSRLLDLTGDSSAELVRQQGTQWAVFQLTGADPRNPSWTPLGTWNGTQNVSLGGVTVADVNGDSMMDILSVSGSSVQLRFGSAAGLTAPVLRPAIDLTRSFVTPGSAATSFPDINGDGLADAVYLATTGMYLYLGKGDGLFERYRDVPYPWTGTVVVSQIRLGDLNRDGLLDVAVVRGGNVEWYRGLANGTLDPTPVSVIRPAGTDASVVVALADANGNGSEDIVWSSDAGMWLLDLAGPTSAGMLTSIDNGLGQSQAFRYDASTQLAFTAETAGAAWATTLPISVPVTIGTRVTLGSGEPARSTRLDVRDGIYDRSERRFIGFSQTTLSRPDPADGAPAAQIIRQTQRFAAGLGLDRVLRGALLSDRIETGAGAVIRETTNDVAAMVIAGLPASDGRLRRAIVNATEVRHFEGQPSALVTRTEFLHDSEGRVTEERALGRLDLSGDETIRRHRYTEGRSARGVRDLVCDEQVLGLVGTSEVLTSQRQVIYGDDAVSAPLCDAGAGWVRVERAWLTSEARWVDVKATTFSARGNPLRTTEGGVTREVLYDANDLHPVAELARPSAARTLRWEMTWDNVLGQPVLVRDATGAATAVTYDGLGRVRSVGRSGRTPYLVYRYHTEGPRPFTETFSYDGDEESITALPATWTPGAGWRHEVASYTSAGEPRFGATRLDAARWLVADRRQRDALGRTISISEAFEVAGDLSALTSGELPTTAPVRTVAYDALDRPTVQTIPTGGHNVFTYRAFETTVTTDGLAPVTTTLDGQDRILRTARTIGTAVESVEATYDPAGQITRMRLPSAAGTVDHQFTYDSLGRLVFATDPDIGNRQLAYDDGGRLIRQTNGAGQVIQYGYDGAGRLTSNVGTDSQFTYHYDDALDAATFGNTAGKLAYVEEPTGLVELGYDVLGREVRRRRSIGTRTASQENRYGASGLLLSSNDGDGLAFTVGHDAAGRVTGLGSLWQVEALDASGRPLRERFGNGAVQTYQRDALGHATRIQILRPSGAAAYDAGVTYNAYGAITAIADNDGVGLNHAAAFSFDGGARLVDAVLGTGAGAYHFRYAYDGLQNMIRREAVGPSALGILSGTHRYGEPVGGVARGPRQLTSILPDAAAGSPVGALPTTFDYDAAGRTVRQGSVAMDYNGFDQLIRVRGAAGAGSIVTHAYGYDGLRVRTIDPAGRQTLWFTPEISETDDGVRRVDVRAGDRLIARITRSPVAGFGVAGAAGATVSAATLIRGAVLLGAALALAWLLLGARRQRVWRPVTSIVSLAALALAGCGPATTGSLAQAARTTTQTLYYHQAVGAGPTLVTASDGSVFDERRYEPFGAAIDAGHDVGGAVVIAAVDFARDPHNSLNKLTDPATGWSDHGARWMAPETGRWLTPDPPVKAPEAKFMRSPWALHPYQYVNQNPIAFWDPDGREPQVCRVGDTAEASLGLLPSTTRPMYGYMFAQSSGGFGAGAGVLNMQLDQSGNNSATALRADVRAGTWTDSSGDVNRGIDFQADLVKIDLKSNGLASDDSFGIGHDGGVFNIQVGASSNSSVSQFGGQVNVLDAAITVGNQRCSMRAGVSLGAGMAFRLHHSDANNNGVPEVGFGFDVGVAEFDIKSEAVGKGLQDAGQGFDFVARPIAEWAVGQKLPAGGPGYIPSF